MRNNENPRAKATTREQATAMKEKAVRFLRDVVGDPEWADEFERMSVEEYAAHKKLKLTNPGRKGVMEMARQSRQELIQENEYLLDALEDARDVLDGVLSEYEEEEETAEEGQD